MISKTDIQKLQDLNIEDVAEKLDITVRKHKAICFGHQDTHASLMFNVSRNRYRCFVCKHTFGGPIDLVMQSQGWNFYESCQWLAQMFGIALTEEDKGFHTQPLKPQIQATRKNRVQEEKPDIPYLTRLMAQPVLNAEAQEFLFDERKLSREVVSRLGISSISYDCPISSSPRPAYFDGPALLIPYRDLDGNLISVQSRYLGHEDKPRFRFPKGSHCHIFNMPVLKDLKPKSNVIVTEGVSDCLAMLSAGYRAIAIPSATLLKPEDADLLKGLILHIYPDQDEAGERLYLDLRKMCPFVIHHQLPEGYKDVGQYWAAVCS